MVDAIPEGMNTVTPYLVVPDSVEAMAFYARAFGAKELMRLPGPGGQGTMHAEIQLGNSHIMLTDENPQWEMKSPGTLGGSPVSLMIYVEDADAVFAQATEAGCTVKFPLSNQFWGDRMGRVTDLYGYDWAIATHIEDVPPEEMAERQQAWLKEMQASGEC